MKWLAYILAVLSLEKRLADGEAEAFDEAIRQYHGSLYRLCHRVLDNDDDAQEAVQETFLAAYQGRDRFRAESQVHTWLCSIAYNKAMDTLRRLVRDQWMLEGELEDSPIWEKVQAVADFTEWIENPEQNYERGELQMLLEEALGKVPAVSRAVFELRDLQGFSSQEVAETVGISEGAVRVRLHRVRQYLTVELENMFQPGVSI